MRRKFPGGVTLSTPEISAQDRERLRWKIVQALLEAHHGDVDIADLLAAALRDAAARVGGANELLVHRSASWEAADVRHLAGGWEHETVARAAEHETAAHAAAAERAQMDADARALGEWLAERRQEAKRESAAGDELAARRRREGNK